MTTAWHGYKNVERMSVISRPGNFSEHARRMRDFRRSHGRIETAKSKDSRNPLGLLSPIPLSGIAVMLRNSQN